MDLLELWSPLVILLCAFIIGWAAEAAQTFLSRALALSLLAWLQTLPEFAVEASVAWNQQRDLMIANLTGSLRLLVGLGWPMIFFVHFFSQGIRNKKIIRAIHLDDEDFLSVVFLFISVLYFIFILLKRELTCIDSIFLIVIYGVYLYLCSRLPPHAEEELGDLPWVSKIVVKLRPSFKMVAVTLLFAVGGYGLYVSVEPFIETLQKWSLGLGISTFVFIQWVAPFLSEFPEKVSAFNWARQSSKAGMAVMNMVNSNINQWTMLAAMIPIVFNISLGTFEAVHFDGLHWTELALTIAQSVLGGFLLLDMQFSIWDATFIFLLWAVQFVYAPLRELIAVVYVIWIIIEAGKLVWSYKNEGKIPRALALAKRAWGPQ